MNTRRSWEKYQKSNQSFYLLYWIPTYWYILLEFWCDLFTKFIDFRSHFPFCFTRTIWTLLMTNVCAVTMMTRLIVNDMKQRKKGVIVNVSSGTHLQPAPYACVYAATKVRMHTLDCECWNRGWSWSMKISNVYARTHNLEFERYIHSNIVRIERPV